MASGIGRARPRGTRGAGRARRSSASAAGTARSYAARAAGRARPYAAYAAVRGPWSGAGGPGRARPGGVCGVVRGGLLFGESKRGHLRWPYPFKRSPTSATCASVSRVGARPGTDDAVSHRRHIHSSWAVRS